MTRRVLLVEIGTPAELPVVTPPAPRPPSAWVPDPRPSPGLLPPTGLAVEIMADAAKLTWVRSVHPGAMTVVEGAPDEGGVPGPWLELTTTADDNYTIALPSGPFWVRLYALLNGRQSVRTNAVLAVPLDVEQEIGGLAQEMRDDFADMAQQIADVQQEAQQAAAALRDDLDVLTAQVDSILGSEEWDEDTDYTAGTPVKHEGELYVAKQDVPAGTPVTDAAYWQYVGEYNSVADAVAAVVQQSESNATEIEAHATVLAALGAMTPDGTAFLLDLNSVRVGPDETLAQRLSGISAAFGDANARIDAEELARANADAALSQRTEAMESRMPTGTGDLATAQSVAQVTNRVDTVEDTVSAHSGQLATHTAEIAGKADSSTVTALDNYVKQDVDGRISTNASAISSVNTQIGSLSASVTQLSEVTGAANLTNLINAGFETGDGWSASSSGGPLPDGIGYSTTGQPRTGTRTMRFFNNGTIFNLGRTPVTSGELLTFGGWVRAWGTAPPAGARFHVGLRHRDASGSFMSGQNVAATVNGTGSIFGYTEAMRTYAVPAGAAHVEMYIIVEGMSVGSVQWDDMYIERVSRVEAEMRARYSLAVTAGGDVAGMQLLAGGGTSAIRFLANSMDVVDPGGASGWSLVGGIATWRKGSHMVVIGPGFGANNEFMYWSGPIQSNLANCRRNNAIRYETVAGESFQRGGIIAGTRVHSGFNPALTVPSIYTTPTLGTGGNPIAVNASVSYFRHYTTDNNAGRFTPGPGSNTATLQLWRKIGSGSWSMVASQTLTGSLQIIGEPTTSDQALWNINGAITFTDTAGGTQNRQYEARLVARTLQGVSVQNPAHNIVPVTEQQSVGIVTEEDP